MGGYSNRRGVPPGLRLRVLKRDGYRCTACGATPRDAPLEADHIVPASQGGRDELPNLRTLCRPCNRGKGSNTDADLDRPVKRYRFSLPIRTEAALKTYLRLAAGLELPDTPTCENHTTPWAAFAGAYFAREPVQVWKASRGFGGKSHALAALGWAEATTLGAQVNVLGGSGQQSKNVVEAMTHFWMHGSAPRWLLASGMSQVTRLSNKGRITALLASQTSVRGPHPQRLRMDEIDEMDVRILDAALGQPMDARGLRANTVLSSTHHNAGGTMSEILRRARDKGWPIREWCYRENLEPHGWLSLAEVKRKRATVTSQMWDNEYEGQRPNPDARAINKNAVERMFDPRLGIFEGADNEQIDITTGEVLGEHYTGADWARKVDKTAIITFRDEPAGPLLLVAFVQTNKRPWPTMTKLLDDRLERFGGDAAHDATGLGDVVAGFLCYPAEDVLLVGRERSSILSEYIAAIERDEIRAPRIQYAYEEHLEASVDDVFGSGHPPDTIVAGALAYHAARRGERPARAADLLVPASAVDAGIEASRGKGALRQEEEISWDF